MPGLVRAVPVKLPQLRDHCVRVLDLFEARGGLRRPAVVVGVMALDELPVGHPQFRVGRARSDAQDRVGVEGGVAHRLIIVPPLPLPAAACGLGTAPSTAAACSSGGSSPLRASCR